MGLGRYLLFVPGPLGEESARKPRGFGPAKMNSDTAGRKMPNMR